MQNKLINIIKALFLSIMFVVFIYPLFLTVVVSLKAKPEVWGDFFGMPAVLQFHNYPDAWRRGNIGTAFFNSIYITIITVSFQLLLSNMSSFIIARVKIRINNFLHALFSLGVMIPIHAILLPIARRAVNLGMSDSHFYLICVYIAGGLPWLVFLMVSYMRSIPEALEEAAIIDGCNLSKVYFHVTLQMSKPILITSAIISFIGSYNELLIAMIILKTNAKKTIPVALSAFTGFNDVNFPQLTAAIVISIIPTIILYLFFQEKMEKGLTAGALKG